MVKEAFTGGRTVEKEQLMQGGETLPAEQTSEIQVVVRGEMEEITEGTSSDPKDGVFEEEHIVTGEELALIAAELIEQRKVEAHFVQEQVEAEEDGKEVAGYTENIGVLRSGTRRIAQLILAGLVWLSVSDWGTVKAHADPVTLSANKANPEGGSKGVLEKELSGDEIRRLEREEQRHVSLEDFLKLNTCKSEEAARLWAKHKEVQRNNEERLKKNPRAKLEQSPINLIWTKKGERAETGAYWQFFSTESSVQDEQGNIVSITKFFVVATFPGSVTRQLHELGWTGYLGTNEERAARAAETAVKKM